jgi:hypothetical protein
MFNKTVITLALLMAVSSIASEESFHQWTVTANDFYGSADVIAEQLQLTDETTLSNEFFYLDQKASGASFLYKGDTITNGGKVDGRITARVFYPKGMKFNFDNRAYDFLYDRTIENRYPMIDQPADLGFTPTMRWNRWSLSAEGGSLFGGEFAFGYRFDRKKGSKSAYRNWSLPAVIDSNRDSGTFWLSYDITKGKLDINSKLTARKDDGQTSVYGIDRTYWSGSAGARYVLSDKMSLFGSGLIANNQSTPNGPVSVDLTSDIKTGNTGFAYQSGALTGAVSAGITIDETAGLTLHGDDRTTNLDRTKTTTKLNATVRYNGIFKTKLSAKGSLVKRDSDQTIEILDDLGGNVLESNIANQEKTVSKFAFKATRKIAGIKTRASLEYRAEQTDRLDEGDLVLYYQPERKKGSMKAKFCGKAKLFGVSTKAGGQVIRQSIDFGESSTTFDANRMFVTMSKMHGSWLAVNAHVSYGQEKYGIAEDVIGWSDSMNLISYDTTTLRVSHGATLITGWVTLNGQMESIHNRDSVENDYTRWYCSATRQWASNVNLIAGYKRYEFDENRWDDFIVDQYSLSIKMNF